MKLWRENITQCLLDAKFDYFSILIKKANVEFKKINTSSIVIKIWI